MSSAPKSIHQLDQDLTATIKEITRLAVQAGGSELDAAVVAYRRAGLALGSNLGRITKAMKEEGSTASRARTGAGAALPAHYGDQSAGFGLKDSEKWPSGFKIT